MFAQWWYILTYMLNALVYCILIAYGVFVWYLGPCCSYVEQITLQFVITLYIELYML